MDWVMHFGRQRPKLESVADYGEVELGERERRAVGPSMAEFQRGESSEARDYLQKSEAAARLLGDAAFHEASLRFVAEENEHARMLGRYMDAQGLPRLGGSWGDEAFRWLRGQFEMAWCSRVLVSAELLAQIYYPALREATAHPGLREICEQIITDEEYHIFFQIERIRVVESRLPWWRKVLYRALHPPLFLGTAVVVWGRHRLVFKATHSFVGYLWEALLRYAHLEAGIALPDGPSRMQLQQTTPAG